MTTKKMTDTMPAAGDELNGSAMKLFESTEFREQFNPSEFSPLVDIMRWVDTSESRPACKFFSRVFELSDFLYRENSFADLHESPRLQKLLSKKLMPIIDLFRSLSSAMETFSLLRPYFDTIFLYLVTSSQVYFTPEPPSLQHVWLGMFLNFLAFILNKA